MLLQVNHENFVNSLKSFKFKTVSRCKLTHKGWVFYDKIKGINKGNWVYAFHLIKGDYSRIVKLGGTGAKNGMNSRMNSYQSGHSNYNKNNGPQNRRVYRRIECYLKLGYQIELIALECSTENIKIKVPWREYEVAGDTQTYKIYEEDIIKLYQEIYHKTPLWNRYGN